MQGLLTSWFKVERGEPHLLGSRCNSCGAYYFPPQLLICRNAFCDASQLTIIPLSNAGTLWSYTTLYEKPPPPFSEDGGFSPLSIGVVELPVEKIKIVSYLDAGADSDSMRIGQGMRLVMREGAAGNTADYRSLRWRTL